MRKPRSNWTGAISWVMLCRPLDRARRLAWVDPVQKRLTMRNIWEIELAALVGTREWHSHRRRPPPSAEPENRAIDRQCMDGRRTAKTGNSKTDTMPISPNTGSPRECHISCCNGKREKANGFSHHVRTRACIIAFIVTLTAWGHGRPFANPWHSWHVLWIFSWPPHRCRR